MNLEQIHITEAVVIGIGAALIMDLWNLFLKRAFDIASLNFCLVGRWLSHNGARDLYSHSHRKRG